MWMRMYTTSMGACPAHKLSALLEGEVYHVIESHCTGPSWFKLQSSATSLNTLQCGMKALCRFPAWKTCFRQQLIYELAPHGQSLDAQLSCSD